MPTSGLAEILATNLELGNSFDNLTEYADLKILAERLEKIGAGQDAPDADAAESIIVTCDDLPPVTFSPVVEAAVWVGDEAGNWDYCVTTITVEEWMGSCGSHWPVTTIYCSISNEDLEPISLVTVNLSSLNGSQSAITSSNGSISFNPVSGELNTISPNKNINPLNGVTTYDLYLIQQHLLGIKPFTSPYKLIAADINNNCEVSIADILSLKKIILNPIDPEFKNNTSWRFVDGGYAFPNPIHPCDFAETKKIEISSNFALYYANFIAVKIGDVSGDHNPESVQESSSRYSPGALIFHAKEQELVAGREYEVDILANQFQNIEAYQYTLMWNRELMELLDVKPAWADLHEADFGLAFYPQGLMSTSWHGTEPTTLPDGMALYTLKIRALESGPLSQALSVTSGLTPSVAYQNDGEEMDVQLHFTNDSGDIDKFELFQNEPNPFSDLTRIGFYLPDAGEATLTIHDVMGRVMYQASGVFSGGTSSFVVFRSAIPAQGLVYYTVQSGENSVTRQMALSK